MKIDIYPEVEKPEWVKVGAWCYCWGEGFDKFRIVTVGKNAAILEGWDNKRPQGWESFAKLHREVLEHHGYEIRK